MSKPSKDDTCTDYEQDLISRGQIPQDSAEEHFRYYQKHLDPYIHNILALEDCLADIRSRSSLLTAAICTSAAFCSGSKDYDVCFKVLRQEVSGKMFSNHHNFDDVRALCIGAFWVHDVSSALNALAVRIASELDLHRCITKMPHTKRECYERTRLYFLVYLCDHHCTLSYGRPPMTRELQSLKSPRALLRSEFSTPSDLRLISQVELWSISSRVFDLFGADVGSPLVRNKYTELEHLGSAYDTWRREWLEVLTFRHVLDRRHIFDLYFHSAKLYLYSHVFRGPSQSDLKTPGTTNDVTKLASCAVEHASSLLRCLTDSNEAQFWLEELPSYFGTTIAFASVFLLRASWHEQPIYNVDTDDVFQHLHRLIELLHGSSVVIHSTHLLLRMASSLEIAIGGRLQTNRGNPDGNAGGNVTDRSLDFGSELNVWGEDIFNFNMNVPEDHYGWMAIPDGSASEIPPLANFEERLV